MTADSLPLGPVKITPGGLEDCLAGIARRIRDGGTSYAMPLNWTKYLAAERDPNLREAILAADWVIADGKPILWLSRRLGYAGVRPLCGIDLAEAILGRSRAAGWRIFLLGAQPESLARAAASIERRFDSPIVAGARHGYFAPAEIEQVLADINASRADILLLGLGMPQKEYFIRDHLSRLDVRFCLPVGGAFDIWSGAKRRSPRWLNRMGLEWLQRSFYNASKAAVAGRAGLAFLKEWRDIRK
jgi:N-acetylglucosaminyldiphosphoundecaprenol N-acetyl-beta-D-mannosaminyltransferase